MFWHSFKNTFKVLIRQKVLIFWSLIFPIILGIFFKLALGNIDNISKFKAIPVAVNEELLEDENFNKFIKEMEDEEFFKVTRVLNQDLLDQKDITAYIKSEDEIVCKESGINESIVQTIMDSYLQNKSMILNILKDNPQADMTEILKVKDHIKASSRGDMNVVNTYFYTLIGMQLMYGYSWGLFVIYQYQANLSTKAKRNAVSPVRKPVTVAASMLVAFLINTAIVFITILIFRQFMGVDFSNDWPYLLLLLLIGSLTGVLFGMLIGASNKADIGVKSGMGIGITMLLSYMAGMMDSEVKINIQESMPILNKINPVSLITDGIYSLYYYPTKERFFQNILYISLMAAAFFILTVLFIRGRQYDNL